MINNHCRATASDCGQEAQCMIHPLRSELFLGIIVETTHTMLYTNVYGPIISYARSRKAIPSVLLSPACVEELFVSLVAAGSRFCNRISTRNSLSLTAWDQEDNNLSVLTDAR